jgi:hypothetical protein
VNPGRPLCGYCGHGEGIHNAALAVGGLFQAGTRPCTAIITIEVPANADPATITSATRVGWWPCSCDNYTTDLGGDEDE